MNNAHHIFTQSKVRASFRLQLMITHSSADYLLEKLMIFQTSQLVSSKQQSTVTVDNTTQWLQNSPFSSTFKTNTELSSKNSKERQKTTPESHEWLVHRHSEKILMLLILKSTFSLSHAATSIQSITSYEVFKGF